LVLLSDLLLAAVPAHADEPARNVDLSITVVMRELGMFEVVRDIPQMLADGLAQQRREAGESETEQAARTALEKSLNARFNERELMERVRAQLIKRYDASRYSTLQRLLQSPIARKALSLKKDALSESATEEIRKLARNYSEKDHDKERLALLRQLDDASGDTEFFVAAQALAIYALARVKQPGSDASLAVDGMLQQTYEQLIRPSRFTTTMTYLHAYRAQSVDEIGQFVDLYSFADVQWFLAGFMDALRTVVLDLTEQVRRETVTQGAR
jgi:hypothetical protein